MSYPTPYTVQHEAYVAGATDTHGNEVPTWAAPVDVAVHGWAPARADTEPFEIGRDAVVRDVDLYAPPGTVVAPRDRMTLAGVLFDVVGHEQDFTRGPFGFTAGVRIALKRAEG